MARIRSVWPDFFRDPKILALPYEARWLFQGIWTESDDEGRMPCSTRQLAGLFFPNDHKATERRIEGWIQRLVAANLLVLYHVDGLRYSFVRNWKKYQRPNRPQPAKYPPPPPDTLFETDSFAQGVANSRKGSRTNSRSHSVNGAVTNSRQERRGEEGSKDLACDETTQNAPPQSAPDPPGLVDESLESKAVTALVGQGKTEAGARETVLAIGPEEVLRRMEAG